MLHLSKYLSQLIPYLISRGLSIFQKIKLMRKYLPLTLSLLMFGIIAGTIDLSNLDNYANQGHPNYITDDNSPNGNPITDEAATLGRVLFYDKNLSRNNTIACASCHIQQFAFGDTAQASVGVSGTTGRHSMRLINARFADEVQFFWDERAPTLEFQTTQPIQDHAEMGFSGTNGDPDFNDLLDKLDNISYYNDLFYLAFGDTNINENRMQRALSQFIRSIQSFDSPFDVGRAQAANDGQPFPNFTNQQNAGKALFLAPPQLDNTGTRIGGGAGCGGCHQPPEFDIDPNSGNNGVIGSLGNPGSNDYTNTRSPSLRDLFNPNGSLNGPLMHTGGFNSMAAVLSHYDSIVIDPNNQNLDPRLAANGNGQKLALTNNERAQLVSFIRTLSGSDVYTNAKWSDPFDANGNLTLLNSPLSIAELRTGIQIEVFPNPVSDILRIEGPIEGRHLELIDWQGRRQLQYLSDSDEVELEVSRFKSGVYTLILKDHSQNTLARQKLIIRH